ncbi:MAG TPA: glycosyltransferase family 39 protein [bacterium]|nr:glycosyltransferase family 39 protein [bacterium]
MKANKFAPYSGPLAILALWLALVLPSLDRSTMQEYDELTHARVAQAAALDGHWWPLVLDGRTFYEKPPLLLWLAGATAKVSGRPYNCWPYRCWTCLGAGLCLAFLVLIGVLLERPGVGWLAALILSLQGDFIYHARFFTFDTPFLACVFASLAFSLSAATSRRPRDWFWAGAALGLAAAFKSWFVFTVLPAYACALAFHVRPEQRKAAALALVGPPLAVLSLWILLYVHWMGEGFLTEELFGNLAGRIAGMNAFYDPDGHAAFYLKWAAMSAPTVLPWVLAAPPALASAKGSGTSEASGAQRQAWSFLRTWTCVFCLSWLLGMAFVRSETINYALPLEAGLCMAAALIMDSGYGAARSLLRTGLLAASLLAVLRLWDPFWSLALGAAFGLPWLFLGSKDKSVPKTAWAGTLSLILGLGIFGLLSREAAGLLLKPLDPSRPIAELLLAHPARSRGETLWMIGGASQAANFYSSYTVRNLDYLPDRRPTEASLVKTKAGWIFFPASPSAARGVGLP